MAGSTPPSDVPPQSPPPGGAGSGSGGQKKSDRELIEGALRAAQPRTRAPHHEDLLPPADSFPGYEIIREIHRGGQGIVYQAIQKTTKRKVAVKVLHMGPFAGSRGRARFDREVAILAQLEHPNIVSVLDSGLTSEAAGNQCFYVMDYVSGQTLDVYLTSSATKPIQEILGLFLKICDAVNAAHLKGITHRDLKPSNIRIDHSGEPHVLDFGLAKIVTGEVTESVEHPEMMSMTGQFIGSLPWASPEQAEGAPSKIDIRSDVYSLGVILYQLLTGGKFPYQVIGNMRDVMDNILRAEPARPSTVRKQINDEVETIVLKTLQKERDRRYQSAGELAKDIKRYLTGQPIEAMRDSGWYMIRKTVRRHKIAFIVAASMLAVVVGVSTYAYLSGVQMKQLAENKEAAVKERDLAVDARIKAEEAKDAFCRMYDARTKQGRAIARASLNDFYVRIKDLIGVTPERAALLDAARTYMVAIKDELKEDPDALIDLAMAHEFIGELLAGLHVPRLDRENASAEGLASYDEACRIREQLLSRDPGDFKARTATATAYRGRALAKQSRNDFDGAFGDSKAAMTHIEAALKQPGQAPASDLLAGQAVLASLVLQLGDIRFAKAANLAGSDSSATEVASLMREGERYYKDASEHAQKRVAANPDDFAAARSVWVCLDKTARAKIEFAERLIAEGQKRVAAGDKPGGIAFLDKAVVALAAVELRGSIERSLQEFDRLRARWPQQHRVLRDIAIARHNMGRVLMDEADAIAQIMKADPSREMMGQNVSSLYQEAQTWFEQALATARELRSTDIKDLGAKRDVALMLNKVGNCQRELGKLVEAQKTCEESLSLRDEVLASDATLQHRRDRGLALQKLGRVKMLRATQTSGIERERAAALAREAIELLNRSLSDYQMLVTEGAMKGDAEDIAEPTRYRTLCEEFLNK
ncbi:MAG: serine/threonine protein kinase [Pyrinomonadaceae bacterium]|nr:serine/threonine protein kinase [Phycisphaerales bacterium]